MLCFFFFLVFHHAWGLQLPHSFIIICVMNFYGHVSLAFMVLRVPREYFRSWNSLQCLWAEKIAHLSNLLIETFFLPSQFTCPGHCCALWHQFHRNFSLFDASAWRRIFRSDHTFIFSLSPPSLASPSSFSSYIPTHFVMFV